MSKAISAAKIDESLEAEIGRNVRELKRTDAASPSQENATEDKSTDDFATVLPDNRAFDTRD